MDPSDVDRSDEGFKSSPLDVSKDEKQILELYDRIQQMQLEIALLTAQKNYKPSYSPTVMGNPVHQANSTADQNSRGSVKERQDSLLESRSKYILRNDVVSNVLMAKPILQAVHNGTNARPVEQDLLPLVIDRDSTSSTLAQQSTSLRETLDQITEVESQNLRISRKNVELASQVLALAEETKKYKDMDDDLDPEQAQEIARLEDELRASRRRWRVMKDTASAIIVGSGIDWARDEQLREVVLDEDGA